MLRATVVAVRTSSSRPASFYHPSVARPESPSPRRSTSEQARNRHALLDAAQQLMLEEGYAAVTARRVAAKAGLKPQLVHYYFSSMDELLVSILRRGADVVLRQLQEALDSPQPLRALWALNSDPVISQISTEFLALAHHRKAIAKEIAEAVDRYRLAELDAVRKVLAGYGVDEERVPAGAALVALTGMAQLIVMEQGIGATAGHDDAVALVERYLTELEGEPLEPGPS